MTYEQIGVSRVIEFAATIGLIIMIAGVMLAMWSGSVLWIAGWGVWYLCIVLLCMIAARVAKIGVWRDRSTSRH